MILGTGFAVASALPLGRVRAADIPGPVQIEAFDPAGRSLGHFRLARVIHSASEWHGRLSPESFAVTREAATESAFTGAYWNWHADGLFRCVCCATALFDSRDKFDSGTGWPSFTRPISSGNVVERKDTSLFMVRTAVSCARCEAHLGHVFDDGPPPAGLRYCINSAALSFVHRAHVRG